MSARAYLLVGFGFAAGCGAADPEPSDPGTVGPETETVAETEEASAQTGQSEVEEQPPPPEPEPPPAPEPIEVVAGTRLGPVEIGMSEEQVQALGLEEERIDSRSRRFGRFRVFFDRRGVSRIEAVFSELQRIRVGERVYEAGTHIHEMRDGFGDCVWVEGGGERYRCQGGGLHVQTTHTLSAASYTLAVERQR